MIVSNIREGLHFPSLNITLRASILLIVASIIVLFSFTTLAFAKGNAELEATIREAILTDPRSAEMTVADVNAMVVALAEEASAKGLTAEEIMQRPLDPPPWSETADQSAVQSCGYAPFFCALNDAFGFSGSATLIPLLLAVCSAILLFTIGSILLHQHGHHPFAGNLSDT